MRARRRGGAALLAGSVVAGLAVVPMVAVPAVAVPGNDSTVFINEFHYDNTGTDQGEFIEVAGPAGTALTGWSIVRYNGSTPSAAVVYTSPAAPTTLSGTIPDQQDGYGTVVVDFPQDGLQNGASDGFALVNGTTVVQLLSYEGALTASNGPAAGLTSTNISVSQGGSEPVGSSLQLTGTGLTYGDFSWIKTDGSNTKGAPNTDQFFDEPPPPPPPPTLDCEDPATFIHEVQGSGLTSPLMGQQRAVQGVVTTTERGLNGYYVQEEPEDRDADPATSEGIFVFIGAGNEFPVATGQLVRVLGTVGEFTGTGSSQTQITNSQVVVCEGTAPDIDPVPVHFPVPSTTYLERYEGMLVELADTLVISEYFNYDRFGEVVLAKPFDGEDRLHTPTAVVDSGAPAQQLAAEQALRIITLDDKNGAQNPAVIPHPGNGRPFGPPTPPDLTFNTFRGGDTVTGVQGVIDHTFGLYRIQPTVYGDYEMVNPRPADPPEVGGSLTVASFNVLNYFLTLDLGPDVCGPLQNVECRGADSPAEFDRQRPKIIEAIAALDADVVGLMEMENTPGVDPAADLVAGLNAKVGAGTYDSLDTGLIGTDAIRLGFLYKPGKVRPVGDFELLDSSDDPAFIDTLNRPMLTQTFDQVATGARLTVSVNHLKSKGSDCNAVADPDTLDGQGNCNVTRTRAAQAIARFLATDPTGSGDPDHLVIGDLNSYDHEDPIKALEARGFTDLVKKYGGDFAYGFVFDAKVGYLDHALSNPSLTPQITGAAEWHINADEPDILDYNLDFGRPASFFRPDLYRSSDHDPVLVGLDLISVDRCYADDAQSVESYAPGRRANGTAVPPAFRDAAQALGLSDPDQSDPYWVSLGLGGEIVLEFDSVVFNNNGSAPDLRVVDGDDGAKGTSDAAVVHASADGQTWVELGRVVGTGEVDLGALETARYVKIVDDTTGALRPATDGYDLDAVEVLTGCA
jgi:uncharacterized protein